MNTGRTVAVQKRFGRETLDVREFIRPTSYMVAEVSDRLWRRTRSIQMFVQKAYAFILTEVRTPTGNLVTRDWHQLNAFHDEGSARPLVTEQANDFWAFPSETLTQRIGDCDDKCILLTSMLRRYIGANRVFCTVGALNGVGHMWVTVDGRVLETTAERPPVQEGPPYDPMFRFNDNHTVVLRALTDLPLA